MPSLRSDAALYALRTLAGVASAATFVGGGLLATRLSARAPHPGLVLGLYYGGAGLGILGADGAGAAAALARRVDRARRAPRSRARS